MWSDRYRLHDTGAHPESPERIDVLQRVLSAAGMFADRLVLEPNPATIEQVEEVHAPELVMVVRDVADQGGGWLDPDTYVSPASFEVALLAAGGACQAVDVVMAGRAPRAFALVRPPGHHAEPARAMGFCLFNNIAIAATHARQQHGLERIAIVDWDVHHGNGTQAAFWTDPTVLFISLHQYPHYPGSGAADERGGGPGEGYTINIPLPARSGDDVYAAAFENIVLPALHTFAPQLLLVSAGFDAHEDDPLAWMALTTDGFIYMARALQRVADEYCDGKLVLVLEGGYNLTALGRSVVAVVRALDDGAEAARRGG
jgi:acetoin utilization deacetylase AcuC-like enzyme